MSSDDQTTKAELAYLRSEVAALWKVIAAAQEAIAAVHRERIKDLLGSERQIDAAKLN